MLILQMYTSSSARVLMFFENGEGSDSAVNSIVVASQGHFERREGEDEGRDVVEKEREK